MIFWDKGGSKEIWASQVALAVKDSVTTGDIADVILDLVLGTSPGGGNGNPLQYSCLENPVDKGAWQATVHRATKSRKPLKRFSMQSRFAVSGRPFNAFNPKITL